MLPRDGPATRVHGKRSHTESEQPHEEGMARKVAAASTPASAPQEKHQRPQRSTGSGMTMSSRATAEAAPEPLIQNVPAESSAAAPRQTRPQHIDDEATDIECDPRPFAPEPDDIFSTSDTRTRPTYRPGNQCFVNASLTALFACGPVRRLLQHVHRTKSTAPPSARWRAYN